MLERKELKGLTDLDVGIAIEIIHEGLDASNEAGCAAS